MSKIFSRNAKMKKSDSNGFKVFNFGIPAFKSKTGFKTCPKAGTCAIGCYAMQGAYTWSNVSQAFERRLELTKSPKFIDTMVSELQKMSKGKKIRIRIHDSGDFYNSQYLVSWFNIMRKLPNIEFYAYTKQVKLLKKYMQSGQVPNNFTVIFSYGGLEDSYINPETDRHSKVFDNLAELEDSGYIDASSNDSLALTDNPKIGLVYHGAKSKNWSKK